MRHECTCGFELAPEDDALPLDAISHGLCARCAETYYRRKDHFWFSVSVNGYLVQLCIQPSRQAPHVAMDSPQYWDPPRPMRVIGKRVYLDGVELDPAEFKDLCAEACRRANVPSSPGGHPSVRPAFSWQLQLGLDRTPQLGGTA